MVQKVNKLLDKMDIRPQWSNIHKLKFTKHGLIGEKVHIRLFLELLRAKEIDLFKELDAYYVPYRVLPEYLLKEFETMGDEVQVDREQKIIIANRRSIKDVKQKVYNVTGLLSPDVCASMCADSSPMQYPISTIDQKTSKCSVVNVCEECANKIILSQLGAENKALGVVSLKFPPDIYEPLGVKFAAL